MKIFNSKLFVGFLCLVIGAGAVVAYQKYEAKRQKDLVLKAVERSVDRVDLRFDDFAEVFEDFEKKHREIFDKDDFFEDFAKMRRKMDAQFAKSRDLMEKSWREARRGDMKSSVSFSESKDSYYYQLSFSGYEAKNITVSVDRGQLVFRSKARKVSGDGKGRNVAVNSFYYGFTVPKYKKKSVKREKGRIVVRLVKR